MVVRARAMVAMLVLLIGVGVRRAIVVRMGATQAHSRWQQETEDQQGSEYVPDHIFYIDQTGQQSLKLSHFLKYVNRDSCTTLVSLSVRTFRHTLGFDSCNWLEVADDQVHGRKTWLKIPSFPVR